MHELIRATAREVLARLNSGEISHGELLDVLEARVADVDGAVNALPTLCFERARERAASIATRPATARGVLGGLPVPIKDLSDVAGVRSTHGSPIYADHVPAQSAHVVERIEAAGGLVYAKSNTPEFGAGGSTFNEVFGRTCNPWNLARSAAGSSGGAAAALASGTAWVAQGSDMGGSLRNPASFCGVAGMRPSPGRVPRGPTADLFGSLSVEGPMARNLGDLGLLLDAMAGADPREPLAQPAPNVSFRAAAEAPQVPRRVAFTPDLGGLTPVDPEVAAICEAAARRYEALGAEVVEASPDFTGAHEAFQTLRAVAFATGHAAHYAEKRGLLKPDVIWNIEKGHALRGEDVARASLIRTRITAGLVDFLGEFDLLLSPATCVAPFPVESRTVTECAGVTFDTYIDWLAMAYAITLTSAPALSLPCGFTRAGLPVGLQIVAPLRAEARLLSLAASLERELAVETGPIDPRPGAASG
ncbi:amidase [Limibaculum sp. M0105]|uniref:Amidase n=1 Tax=Thermohalobaculum xanthum TaxID=2753746 RepID=A0A8J7M9U2_9RHOB|nr:amidase family protein [Thermohalobaculum xanthum]MBK0400353.1 amidase [Thermohalobaculum xanthum]